MNTDKGILRKLIGFGVTLITIGFLTCLGGCSDDDPVAPPPPPPPEQNTAPVVSDIKNQTIDEGGAFQTINLDNYVSDEEDADADITWTWTGNKDLKVSVSKRVATIKTPTADWSGTETITFTAMDTGSMTDSDQARFTVEKKIIIPPSVVLDVDISGSGGCSTCFVVGEDIEATATYKGMQGSVKFAWKLLRSGRTESLSTATRFDRKAYLPGDYVLKLTVSDGYGHKASASRKFSVEHSWWNKVPWGTYRIISEGGQVYFNFDDDLKLIELKVPVYDYVTHDWVAAVFIHPRTGDKITLFNRVKKIRFRNNMAEILYALVISGDSDWWSGNARYNRHWNLGSGSSDRKILNDYKLMSVARIDYPPQHPYDRIHYYGE